MRTTIRLAIVYLVFMTILATISSVSHAQVGPVRGKVVNESGEPLNGVLIEITSDTSPDSIKARTKKKGKFTVLLPELRWEYEFHFQLKGYEDGVLLVEPSRLAGKDLEIMLVRYRSEQETAPEPVVKDSTTKIVVQPEADDVSLQRESAIALYNEGVGALEADDTDTAMTLFRRATVTDPTFPEPYRALIALASEAEDWAVAARTAKALLRFEPDDRDALWTTYLAMLRVGDATSIAESARNLLRVEPLATGELVDNAQSLYSMDEFEITRQLLAVVIEAEPDQIDAYFLAGMSSNGLGDTAAAKPALEKFLAVAPEGHPDVEVAKGILEYLK